MPKKKLKCPKCGAGMNNHAEKISYETDRGGHLPDPDFGGIVEDVYTCPGCGNVEMISAE
jgi:ribosomal protein S27AE